MVHVLGEAVKTLNAKVDHLKTLEAENAEVKVTLAAFLKRLEKVEANNHH